ncbi:MAG: citrate transporter [Ruminococcaceae bacterium]|nr:citrate transporter [Oscillospiraceae bacterium]
MLKKIWSFIKKEAVLFITLICAAATMLLVPPDSKYIEYIDLRVLCLLFCLMAVVAGFQSCGAFKWLAYQLLRKSKSGRTLGVILVLLPFFCSMLVTNDVALIIFVPFTLPLLEQIGCRKAIIPVLVLQTIAANLGSMATPVGNPQNLFLYAAYELSVSDFFAVMLPLTGISLLCLTAASLVVLPQSLPSITLQKESVTAPWKLLAYAALFVLCLLTVFRVIPYGITTIAVFALIAMLEYRLLGKVDYALLATFVCFFVVSGNLSRIDAVRGFLDNLLSRSTLLTSVGASQIISNVPAAVLLSEFTDQWKPLLEGVNIGGLGTPIASLASLITLKFYLAWHDTKPARFLAVFTAANIIGLVILLAVSCLV